MSAKRKTTTVETIRELQRAVQQLQTAIAAVNVLGDRAVLTRTLDATEYKWSEVIQIGGTEIKGATKVLKGKNRNETLQKVAEYVKEK